jgi:hypothetical protein
LKFKLNYKNFCSSLLSIELNASISLVICTTSGLKSLTPDTALPHNYSPFLEERTHSIALEEQELRAGNGIDNRELLKQPCTEKPLETTKGDENGFPVDRSFKDFEILLLVPFFAFRP